MRQFFLLLCCVYIPLYGACETFFGQQFIYHDFDHIMDASEFPKLFLYTEHILHYDGRALLDLGRLLYTQCNPVVCSVRSELAIPKIIHQIWIGGSLPDVFKKYMETWHHMHPDWHYMLWTDENVHELFPLSNQKFFDESNGLGVKSDLLKWEIIYRFGGVYVDVDFECLRPLDQLHYIYDFYTAFQPFDAFFVQLGAAIFAARPGHPLLQHCIATIQDDWYEQGAPKKSGPVHFSKSFMACAGKNGRRDIAFPSFYFYPLGSIETELRYSEWIQKGAYAVHHWAKSWMPTGYRRGLFRSFDNAGSSAVWNE